MIVRPQNRDYNRRPTSVGTFDVNGAAHVASRILAAILLASKNGGFDSVIREFTAKTRLSAMLSLSIIKRQIICLKERYVVLFSFT